MDKKKIQIEYNEKIKTINQYNRFYYDKNNPKVSDQKYDELKSHSIIRVAFYILFPYIWRIDT